MSSSAVSGVLSSWEAIELNRSRSRSASRLSCSRARWAFDVLLRGQIEDEADDLVVAVVALAERRDADQDGHRRAVLAPARPLVDGRGPERCSSVRNGPSGAIIPRSRVPAARSCRV